MSSQCYGKGRPDSTPNYRRSRSVRDPGSKPGVKNSRWVLWIMFSRDLNPQNNQVMYFTPVISMKSYTSLAVVQVQVCELWASLWSSCHKSPIYHIRS